MQFVTEYQKPDLSEYSKLVPTTFPDDQILFKESDVSATPNYGSLKLLEGTWVNYNPNKESKLYGIHTTMMPGPGSNTDSFPGQYHFECDDYTEEFKFHLSKGKVRNRCGANEQLTGVVEYTQNIVGLDGTGLHEENGMFLYLNEVTARRTTQKDIDEDVLNDDNLVDQKQGRFLPQHSITRMGSIPHGNTISLVGSDYMPKAGKPDFHYNGQTFDYNHTTLHPTMTIFLDGLKNDVMHDLDDPKPPLWASAPKDTLSGHRNYVKRLYNHQHYPYSLRPDLRLRDVVNGQEMKEHIVIDLNSRIEIGQRAGFNGSVTNTPMIAKYCPVTEVRFRMWIQTIIEDGEEVLQLQYEQIIFFEFGFGTDGSHTRWPHIQTNTLRQKKWVDAKMKA